MSSGRDPVDRLLNRIRLRRRLRQVMGHSSNALALALFSWAILILSQRLFSIGVSETLEMTIPLGVFLAAAAAISYAWGERMLSWYLTQVVGP